MDKLDTGKIISAKPAVMCRLKEAETRATEAEQALELNAALLARQTDLAREAGIWAWKMGKERDEFRDKLKAAAEALEECLKVVDDYCKSGYAEDAGSVISDILSTALAAVRGEEKE